MSIDKLDIFTILTEILLLGLYWQQTDNETNSELSDGFRDCRTGGKNICEALVLKFSLTKIIQQVAFFFNSNASKPYAVHSYLKRTG